MENKFSKSINIIRDTESNFEYIPTPNSRMVVNQIVNDFKKVYDHLTLLELMGQESLLFFLRLSRVYREKRIISKQTLIQIQILIF